MTIRALAATLLGAGLLAACAPQQASRPGVVHDAIVGELRQAAADRNKVDAADKALMPPLTVEMPRVAAPAEARFDLSVVNAPAAQVFMALVTGTRYNMLVGPDVGGQITVNLKDVTVQEALEAIRELYGYEFKIQGNRIYIQPNTLQTRVFQVNYLASRRLGNTELRVTSGSVTSSGTPGTGTTTPSTGATNVPPGTGTGSPALASVSSRVQTSTDSDFWGNLTTTLGTIVGTEGGRSVVVNPNSGVILVKAFPNELRAVESYLKATQVIVERQVMLEAKILEVALSEDFQSGVNWASFNRTDSRLTLGVAQPNVGLSPTGVIGNDAATLVQPGVGGALATSALGKGFFGLAFQTTNFAALLNFLETQGNVSVLSSPRIATLNNQKAVLKVGTDELYVTNVTTTSTTSTTGTTNTPSLTLQPYFSGISLDVTPQIDEDGNIILHIHPAVSTVTEKEKNIDLGVLGQYKLPLASSSVNETDSIVRVQDGNIVAIGGLMKQSQTGDRSGLPGTTGSPAGVLFGQRSNTFSKKELVILLKPTVVKDDRAWAQDLEQTAQRIHALDPRRGDALTP
jgi:MSHA biogenesis protein MshL